jgi:DNA polymerase III subunit delta
MKLSQYQLSAHLKNNLLPIYLIAGDEPLFVQESKEIIRAAARRLGYCESQYFEASKDFDWNFLLESANNFSLFNNKCLIELHLVHKPNATGVEILSTYTRQPPPDKVLMIISKKLDQATQNASWVKVIIKQGVYVPIWPVNAEQYLQWLQQRLHQHNLKVVPEGIHYLAEQTEGNFLAAAQEIEKLKLHYGEKKLSVDDIAAVISDSAHFDIFIFIDSILQGDLRRIQKILTHLSHEAIEPPLILWAITRELRSLVTLKQLAQNGLSLENALRQQMIKEKRQPLIKQVLKRHQLKDLHRMLIQAGNIDHAIKGLLVSNVWDDILQLSFNLAGRQLFRGVQS